MQTLELLLLSISSRGGATHKQTTLVDLILFTSVIKNTLVKTLKISDEGPHRQTNEINNLKIYLIDEDTRRQQVNLV